MRKVNAFFYDFNYYIMPKDLLMEQINGKISLKKLCVGDDKLGSIPPYFIEQLVEDVVLEVTNAERIFPVEVYLCTVEEYNQILSSWVENKCPGCVNYTPTLGDESLEGHYVEMDLRGNCYLREEKDDRTIFFDVISILLCRLEKKFDAIKKCVDKGNAKKLSAIFNKQLTNIMWPVSLCGKVINGKYTLYCRACGAVPEYSLDVQFLAQVFNTVESTVFSKNGWTMVPFLEEDVARYDGKTKLNDLSRVAYFTQCGENGESELRIFVPYKLAKNQRKMHKYVEDIENYLTCALGEKRYYAWYNIRPITDDSALTTLGEVAQAIKDYYAKIERLPFPKVFAIDMTNKANFQGTHLPNRDKILQLATTAPNLATLSLEDIRNKSHATIWFTHYTFGYIYIPQIEDMQKLSTTLMWYMDTANNTVTPTAKRSLAIVCSQNVCKDDGFIMDILFPNKNMALQRLRTILPVLSAYNAQLTLVDESLTVDTYICKEEFVKL